VKELSLNAETLYTREQAHHTLAEIFAFPDWYGCNLDALYDLLTIIHTDTRLLIQHAEVLIPRLGNYGALLLRVMENASAENPSFQVEAQFNK